MVAEFWRGRDRRSGVACCLTLPQMWLGVDQLQRMGDDPLAQPRVPLLVSALWQMDIALLQGQAAGGSEFATSRVEVRGGATGP